MALRKRLWGQKVHGWLQILSVLCACLCGFCFSAYLVENDEKMPHKPRPGITWKARSGVEMGPGRAVCCGFGAGCVFVSKKKCLFEVHYTTEGTATSWQTSTKKNGLSCDANSSHGVFFGTKKSFRRGAMSPCIHVHHVEIFWANSWVACWSMCGEWMVQQRLPQNEFWVYGDVLPRYMSKKWTGCSIVPEDLPGNSTHLNFSSLR